MTFWHATIETTFASLILASFVAGIRWWQNELRRAAVQRAIDLERAGKVVHSMAVICPICKRIYHRREGRACRTCKEQFDG